VIGVADHAGWAVLVTALGNGTVLDRRRVELVEEGLAVMPHHHEGQKLPVAEAVELVERVRASAEAGAARALSAMAACVPGVCGVALRVCQPLPESIEERLRDYRARNVADWVMYRRAIAKAAEARGWGVYWYEPKCVVDEALGSLGVSDSEGYFRGVKRRMGAPWNVDHRMAWAGAVLGTFQT
jgi:hypothetical protein